MLKKNLLNESQVRQFMKLANLEPLSPGFVHGLTERGYTAKKEKPGEDIDIDESHGRGRQEGGAGYGSPDQNSRNEGLEDDLDATEDEFADEEGEEIDDLEGELAVADDEPAPEAGGRMVSVDDFLEALESALETAMGDEVEVDASEMSDEVEDEEGLEAEDEFAADGEDVVADDEMEDEMLEGFTLGKSQQQKDDEASLSATSPERIAFDKSARKSTPEESAAELRRKQKRGKATMGGHTKAAAIDVGGVTAEGQDALVEQITKRVAARILKAALAKK